MKIESPDSLLPPVTLFTLFVVCFKELSFHEFGCNSPRIVDDSDCA